MSSGEKSSKLLLTQASFFIAASVVAAVMPFLLLPVLTAYIPPKDFAIIGVFQGLYTAFLPLCGLGVGSAIVRQSYDSTPHELGSYIFNAVLVMVVSTAALTLFVVLFQRSIVDGLGFEIGVVYLALFSAASMFVFNIYLGQCQVNQLALRFGILQVSHSALNVGLSLFFTIGLVMGAAGRIWGIALAALAFSCVGVIGLLKMGRLNVSYNPGDIRSALRFGLPLIPHELGTFFTNWLAIILMSALLPAEEVGVYTLAFTAAMALGVLCGAFNRAFVPWLYARLKQNDYKEKAAIVAFTWKYFALMAIVSVVSLKAGPGSIQLVFGESYAAAGNYIGWLVVGQALGGCYLMVTNYLFYLRKTEIPSGITIVSSIFNVALLLIVLPTHGVAGAVFAFVFTRAMIFFLTFYFANRLLPMPWISGFRAR